MPAKRADAAKVAAMLTALDRGEFGEDVAKIGGGVGLATAYRWKAAALAGDARTLADLAAHGWAPEGAARRALSTPLAPAAPPPAEDEDVTIITGGDGRELLTIVHGSPHAALALALGAKGVGGDDAAALVLLLEGARMVAKGASEAHRWADDVFVRWLAASETLFPGVLEQLKRGARTWRPGLANGVDFGEDEEPPPPAPKRRKATPRASVRPSRRQASPAQ